MLHGKKNLDVVKKVQNFSPVKTVRYLLQECIQKAKVIIDATCGAGHDCLFLAQNAPQDAQIVAFDIQSIALEKTAELLEEHRVRQRVNLNLDNYINFKSYISNKIDLIIFNLGYLPQADKDITTQVDDLAAALPSMLMQLNCQGVICIVSYIGHTAGRKEYLWLESYLPELSNKEFNVGKYMLFNHNNSAPIVYIIERVKGESSL